MYMQYFFNCYLSYLRHRDKKIVNKKKILCIDQRNSHVVFNDMYSIKYSKRNPIIILSDTITKSTQNITYVDNFFDLKLFRPSIVIISDHNLNDYNILVFISLIKNYAKKNSLLVLPMILVDHHDYLKNNNIMIHVFDEKFEYPIQNLNIKKFSCLYFQ